MVHKISINKLASLIAKAIIQVLNESESDPEFVKKVVDGEILSNDKKIGNELISNGVDGKENEHILLLVD